MLLAIAAPVHAASLEMLVTAVGLPAPDGMVAVQVTILNDQNIATEFAVPDQVAASVATGGATTAVVLVRADAAQRLQIAPGGFARANYTVRLADAPGPVAVLTLAEGRGSYAFATTTNEAQTAGDPQAELARAPMTAAADPGNAFLSNLSAYQPIYAVYGPGTTTDALIQISFKYQLLGHAGAAAAQRRWTDGITFAYTQRTYWDLGAKSAPFRNIDFQPELFYLFAPRPLTGEVEIAGQAGIRHESNGRDGLASRSLNTIYVHPTVALPVDRYTLRLGPQVWAYVGDLSDNPDIARYRGNTGLFAEIDRDDGLRLSMSSGVDFSTGRGAVNIEASCPLDRLIGSSLNLYVFGQAFAGYGENLLDYNRHATRLRFGLGFVR